MSNLPVWKSETGEYRLPKPVDIVAEMRGSLIALSHTTDITRDKINRWADEVERLQAGVRDKTELSDEVCSANDSLADAVWRLRVLPEQVTQLAERWHARLDFLKVIHNRTGDAYALGGLIGVEECRNELLSLLNNPKGEELI